MIQTEIITTDLRQLLRRLKLTPMSHTLPERIMLARQNNTPYQDFLIQIFSDEVFRRDQVSGQRRSVKAKLNASMRLENLDNTANVSFDRQLYSELCTLRFMDKANNIFLLGPVGVGKTFMATAIGHIACKRGYSTLMIRAERLFKELKSARMEGSYEREMRRFISLTLLIIDDFGIDRMDAMESKDFYEIVVERHGKRPTIITSNREPSEWLTIMDDPIRAQSALDRLQNAAYELIIEGESYRKRQKPGLSFDTEGQNENDGI